MAKHYNSTTETQQGVKMIGQFVLFALEIVLSWHYLLYTVYDSLDLDRTAAIFLAIVASSTTISFCCGLLLFRVILSTLFSIVWGYLALLLTDQMPGTSTNKWAAFVFIFILVMLVHGPILKKNTYLDSGT